MGKARKRLDPIPPGEILLEDFMRPNDISQNRLTRDIDVNPARINDIVHGRSSITAAIALRLGKYFGTTPEFWLMPCGRMNSSNSISPGVIGSRRFAGLRIGFTFNSLWLSAY